MAIAAFALAGCGNGNSSSGASSQPAPSGGSKASLHIVVDYADQNSEN